MCEFQISLVAARRRLPSGRDAMPRKERAGADWSGGDEGVFAPEAVVHACAGPCGVRQLDAPFLYLLARSVASARSFQIMRPYQCLAPIPRPAEFRGCKSLGTDTGAVFWQPPPRGATKPGGFVASVPRDPRPLISRAEYASRSADGCHRIADLHEIARELRFFGFKKPKNGARAARSSADGDGSRHWTRAKDRARHGAAHP